MLTACLRYSWLVPLKARIQAWLGPAPPDAGSDGGALDAAHSGGEAAGAAPGGPVPKGSATAQLSSRLQERFHTKRGAGAGGPAQNES